MGLYSNDVVNLVGQTIMGIEVDDGRAYFTMADGTAYCLGPEWGDSGDGIDYIEGDMRDIIESPVVNAKYLHMSNLYHIETVLGYASFVCSGHRTAFLRD